MASGKKDTGINPAVISLEQKIQFLKDPDNYPEPTRSVQPLQTHMSWVFLTDKFVYKLKIPFRFDHYRLNTTEARYYNCREELRLNRRLAPDVYLDVVPLSKASTGELFLGKSKETVDWLVKMKRLPNNQMLDRRINHNTLQPDALEPVAHLLSEFYTTVAPISLSFRQYREKLISDQRKYRNDLLSPVFALPEETVRNIYHRHISFIKNNTHLLGERIKQKRIVEGHGDLKPDHICLLPAVVIDCLEFDKELRVMDVLDDLAFLSLECDRLEMPWVGSYFLEYYIRYAGDRLSPKLFHFYKSRKAFTRALLSIRHIREPQYREDPQWRKKTDRYLELADKYIQQAL